MLFTPNYAVSYKGKFYQAGKPFEIAEADAAEMSKHGVVQPPQEPPEEKDLPPQEPPEEKDLPPQEPPEESEETSIEIEEPPKRAGRPRKGAEQ